MKRYIVKTTGVEDCCVEDESGVDVRVEDRTFFFENYDGELITAINADHVVYVSAVDEEGRPLVREPAPFGLEANPIALSAAKRIIAGENHPDDVVTVAEELTRLAALLEKECRGQ